MENKTSAGVRPRYKRVPKKLKQLAEERASAAGKLQFHLDGHNIILGQYERVQSKVKELKEKLRLSEEELRISTEKLQLSEEKRNLLVASVASIDAMIAEVAPHVDPNWIEAIRRGRDYSAHGSLREYLHSQMQLRFPDWISTVELSKLAVEAFSLTFDTPIASWLWRKRSIFGALHALLNEGLIEKGPKIPNPGTVATTTWRIKVETQPRLDDL